MLAKTCVEIKELPPATSNRVSQQWRSAYRRPVVPIWWQLVHQGWPLEEGCPRILLSAKKKIRANFSKRRLRDRTVRSLYIRPLTLSGYLEIAPLRFWTGSLLSKGDIIILSSLYLYIHPRAAYFPYQTIEGIPFKSLLLYREVQ